MIKNTVRYLFLLIIVDVLFSVLWSVYILNKTNNFKKQTNVQVVVILMGDFNKDYTQIGSETLRRLNFGLSLFNDFHSKNYLCVGGSRPNSNIYGAELMKDYLQRNGVPAGQIYTDGRSFDTKGNWDDALNMVEKKQWKSVAVISSAFHLYRARKYIIDSNKKVRVTFIPYRYESSNPETNLLDLWFSVHYEWVTYLLYALPAHVYDSVLLFIRPQ